MLKNIIFILFCFIISITGFGQIDKTFWFSAPDISSGLGDSPVFIRLTTYANPANVTVSIPANGSFTPITKSIAANSVDSVDLTAFLSSFENSTPDIALNRGIKISSDQNISAFYEIHASSNKEFVSLKGQKALGTEFYTPFPSNWATGTTTPASYSSAEIVATQNSTVLLITPRTNASIIHSANVSYTVSLNAGQTYSLKDPNPSAASSLAGSIIASNKPVAVTVFSGAVDESGEQSTIMDQLTSVDYIGTDYVIRKGKANNERVYVLATQNNTSVDIFDAATSNSVINSSETKEYILTDTVTYIKSNHPVYVLHVSGFGNKLCGAQTPNVFCSGTNSTAITRTSADSFALTLFVKAGFENQFALNGNTTLIPATSFAPVPGTSGAIVCAQIFFPTLSVAVNSPVLVTNPGSVFGLGVLQGSSANGSSYAYFSEFKSSSIVNAGNDLSVCANSSINISGSISGVDNTALWSSTGFGTFQSSLNSLANIYVPSDLDTAISPIKLILSSAGSCSVVKDTLLLTVNPAPIVNASSDMSICGNVGSIALNGSITGGASTGIWTTNGSGTFTGGSTNVQTTYQLSVSDTITGTVHFVLTASNFGTCNVESDTVIVTLTDVPQVDAGPSSVVVCVNNSDVALAGIITGATTTGKWTTSGTGSFLPNNSSLTTTFQPSADDAASGQVMVFLTSTNNGTCLPVKDSLEVIFTPAPLVNAGADGFGCANKINIQLAGNVSGASTSGYWTGGAGTFSPDSSAFNASYIPTAAEILSGSITLTLISTNNGACNTSSDDVNFSFVSVPSANFTSTSVCNGIATDFTDASAQGYGTITQWLYQFDDGFTSTTANSSHTFATSGSHTVSLIVTSDAGCADTMDKTITVYALPIVDFNDTLTCTGTAVNAVFSDQTVVIAPDSINSWSWDFGSMGTNTTQNVNLSFYTSGSYQIKLTVKTANGCSNFTDQTLVIPGIPHAAFFHTASSDFNISAVVNFSDSSLNASTHLWNFDDGSVSSTELNPTHLYTTNGSYHVTYVVSNNIGCTDTAEATIVISNVTDEISSLIPNAISPNNDGKNDVWKLPFLDFKYPNTSVEIYNQWGQKVFESEGYKTPWDGTFNGEVLPMGNYYYILNLNDADKPGVYKGAILLLR